jgi:histidinol-phosphate aminotransferase
MSLPRPDIDRLGESAYGVPRLSGPIDLWLDGNEGPAPTEAVRQELANLDPEILRRYPDAKPLERELAAQLGVPGSRVFVTAGADEGIDRFCRAFLSPGRNAVVLAPAFEMQVRYAQLAGAEVREVDWMSGEFPIERVLDAVDADTCVIAIASPNNPTGLTMPRDMIEELVRRAPDVWLMLDLVYAEFLDDDPTAFAIGLPNSIVLRSLSKSGGLAGLRVGYAVGPEDAIAAMRRAGGPYSVAGPSLALASRFVRESSAAFEAFRKGVERERNTLRGVLLECGLGVEPGTANFLLARTPRSRWLWEGLASFGIAVRWFAGRRGLEDAVRITCPGDPVSFARLLAGLRATLAPQAILFDMDGVLVDVSDSYDLSIIETAASFGVTVTREDIAAAKARGDANNDWRVTKGLLEARGCDAALDEVTRRFEEAYQTRLWKNEILTVDPEWLAALSRRVTLGVVTGRPRKDAERFLESAGIDACFSTVVCMEDAAPKPSPEPVTLALSRLNCDTAWFVGDTVDDVRAARAAAVVPLGIVAPGDDSENPRTNLTATGAARVLDALTELEQLLP